MIDDGRPVLLFFTSPRYKVTTKFNRKIVRWRRERKRESDTTATSLFFSPRGGEARSSSPGNEIANRSARGKRRRWTDENERSGEQNKSFRARATSTVVKFPLCIFRLKQPPFAIIRRVAKFANGGFTRLHRDTAVLFVGRCLHFHVICRSLP